jgi:predicted nuclease of restriction endonuclease-like RecB superfamily
VLPALRALERYSLVAEIRWGKSRERLLFKLRSDGGDAEPNGDLHVADDVRELEAAINAADRGRWRARAATAILDVPGLGVCIPDLELTRPQSAEPVYVEVLGYWSRDAVFRRVELAERGLGARVVFAVSSRLRVSAQVLDAKLESALYVYKGKMNPRAVLEHAERIARGPSPKRKRKAR